MPVLPDDSYALPPDSVAYYADYQDERSRLTTFFRLFTALPHFIFLALWGIAAFFAVIGAWFAIVFTAKYPQGIYDFIVKFQRYAARVQSYYTLITDKFPPFNGNPDETYEAHLLVGPPLETYSRVKTFFRGILYIPFYIVAYVLTLILQLAMVVAWFVIVFSGKQPRGLQDAMVFCLSYSVRLGVWYSLLTEDWPSKITDENNIQSLVEKGYAGPPPVPSGETPLVEESAAEETITTEQAPPPPAPPTI
jgi:hypothetical protein